MFTSAARRLLVRLPTVAAAPPAARIRAAAAYHASARARKEISMTWHVNGEEIPVSAEEGKTLLEVAHENDIELEGACGGYVHE